MYEARPSVVMEAQSVGKPSVVSNVGDNPYLVNHGDDGFLISPQDEKKLFEYLEALIKDEVLRQRMGRAAMIKAKSEYSILGMIDDHIDIYQQVYNHSLLLV